MALTQSGVEFVAKNLGKYLADLNKASEAQRALGQSVSGIGQQFTTTQANVGGLKTSLGGLGGMAQNIGSQFSGLGQSLLSIGANVAKVGAAITGALGVGVAVAVGQGISKAVDLDQQVANIAATMGVTGKAADQLKENLKGLALDLSLDPNLTVNVEQASQAIEVLAASGQLVTDEFGNISEASKALVKQTVALQNATGSDFPTAAAIATDAAALFKDEMNAVNKAVDGAAGVMNASKFGAIDYQLALSQAGAVASGMGVSIEDFNTVIAGTASAFNSGSDAGTSFKTLLQRLANPTDEMKAAMEAYGISLFNADGSMRNMKDVANDLNRVFTGTVTVTQTVGGATKQQAQAAETAAKNMGGLAADIAANEKQLQLYNDQLALEIGYYGDGSPKVRQRQIQIEKLTNTINDQKAKMAEYQGAIAQVDNAQAQTTTSTMKLTEAQKAELAATLGGADGARILLALSELTGESFDTLSGQVNRSGQALEAAATRVNTVQGAFDVLKGIVEAFQIQIGNAFLPLIREMLVNFTQLATGAGPQLITFFDGIVQGIESLISRGQALFSVFQAGGAYGLVTAMGITPAAIELVNKISEVISSLVTTITGFFTAANQQVDLTFLDALNQGIEFVNENFEAMKGALAGIGAVLAAGVFAVLVAGVMSLLTPINLIVAATAILGAAWEGNWGGIQEKTMAVWAAVEPTLTAIVTWLQTNIPLAIQAASAAFDSLVSAWQANWPIISAAAQTAWLIIQGVLNGFSTIFGKVIVDAQSAFARLTGILNTFGLDWEDVWNAVKTATGVVAAAIGAAILGIVAVVGGIVSGIANAIDAVIGSFQSMADGVRMYIDGAAQVIQGFVELNTALITGDWRLAWDGFVDIVQGAFTAWKGMMQTMLTVITTPLNAVVEFIKGFAGGVVDIFQGIYDTLIGNSIIPDLVNGIVNWFRQLPNKLGTALSNLVKTVTEPFKNMAKAAKEALNVDEWVEIGENAMAGLLQGIQENSGAVLEYLKSLLGDWLGVFTGGMEMQSPSRVFIGYGHNAIEGFRIGAEEQADSVNSIMSQIGEGVRSNFLAGLDPDTLIDDLQIGGQLTAGGLGGGHRRDVRSIIHSGIRGNFGGLVGGQMSGGEMISQAQSLGASYGLPPSIMAQYVDFEAQIGNINGVMAAMARQAHEAAMAALAQNASSLAGLGSSLASELREKIGTTEEAQKRLEALSKATEALSKKEDDLTGKLSDQQGKLKEESNSLKQLQTDLQQATARYQIAGREIDIKKNRLEDLKAQLALVSSEYGANSIEVEKAQNRITALGLEIDAASVKYKQIELDIAAKSQRLIELQTELTNTSAQYGENSTQAEAVRAKMAELQLQLEAAKIEYQATATEIEAKNLTLQELQTQLAATSGQYGENSAEAEKVRQKIAALELELEKATVAYSENQQKVEATQQAIEQKTGAVEEQKTAIEELTKSIEDNDKALAESAKATQAELSKMFFEGNLAERIEAYKRLLESTGDMIYVIDQQGNQQGFTRNGIQAEYNRMLEEQARKEEEIRKAQEAQQKLDFLQQQMSLIEMLRKSGLNPANILGGITLGLSASVEDLLAATNATVNAMITQINDDLQIASPSKVMKKVGQRIMQGMTLGVEEGGAALNRTIGNTPLLGGMVNQAMAYPAPVMMAEPVGGMGAAINFYGGITINNGQDMAQFEQRVTRAVARGFRN